MEPKDTEKKIKIHSIFSLSSHTLPLHVFKFSIGLETVTLGLEFRVRARHFKKGDMKLKVWIIDGKWPQTFVKLETHFICFALFSSFLFSFTKCLATIASIYWKTNEESVEGDRPVRTPPYSSPIESRSVTPNSSSKADRVQGELENFINIIWYLCQIEILSLSLVDSFQQLNKDFTHHLRQYVN